MSQMSQMPRTPRPPRPPPLSIGPGRQAQVAVAWLLLAAIGSAVAASGPLADAGECEMELGFARERVEDRTLERETGLQGACGLGERHEVELSARQRRGAEGRHDQIAVEGRTLLATSSGWSKSDWQWVLTYGLSFEHEPGTAWRAAEHALNVQAGLALGDGWWLEATVGTERDRLARRDRTPWSLLLEADVSADAAWHIELSGADRARPTWVLEWTQALVPDRIELTLGVQQRLGRPAERGVGLGLVFPF